MLNGYRNILVCRCFTDPFQWWLEYAFAYLKETYTSQFNRLLFPRSRIVLWHCHQNDKISRMEVTIKISPPKFEIHHQCHHFQESVDKQELRCNNSLQFIYIKEGELQFWLEKLIPQKRLWWKLGWPKLVLGLSQKIELQICWNRKNSKQSEMLYCILSMNKNKAITICDLQTANWR